MSSLAANTINVQAINKVLQANKAGWVARENSMTQYSKEDLKRMMGLRRAPPIDVEFVTDSFDANSNLPASLDWRNKDGRNWVSPILNQANCGSCVAFATVGVMETQLNISSLIPNLNIRLSPQQLFGCGGGACDHGWLPEDAADFVVRQGVADEACLPYKSGATGEDVACSAACSDVSQRSYHAARYTTPTRYSKDLNALRKALQNGPLITTLNVYEDFVAYSGGIYKHTTGSMLGGHAISIVGYDDNEQVFIIRNSWGEDWGDHGFAKVAYSDRTGVGFETWGFEVPPMNGVVSMVSPRDYSYVSGDVEMNAISSYANADSVSVTVYDQNNKAVWTGNRSLKASAIKLSSAQLADGRYEVQAIAFDSKGARIGSSTREFFYVVNQKPDMSLSFVGKGVDLNSPVSGRIEFDVTAQTSSVPMSSIEFHYKDASGKERTRSSNVVLDHMTMGWRTNVYPDGKFEIWMVGKIKSNKGEYSVESAHYNVTTSNSK